MLSIEIKKSLDVLLEIGSVLHQNLLRESFINGSIFKLPNISQSETPDHKRKINVITISQQNILRYGADSLTSLHAKENHSTRFSLRTPGFMCYSNSAKKSLLPIINSYNQQKLELKALLLQEQNPKKRFDLLHKISPMIITLNVYRQIRVIDNPDHIRFNWANKKSVSKVTKSSILSKLNKQIQSVGNDKFNLDGDINIIKSLPDSTDLRVKRSLPVQPIISINKKSKQFVCVNPVIIFSETGDFSYNNLENYDPKKSRKFRSDSPLIPVIERMFLFKKV